MGGEAGVESNQFKKMLKWFAISPLPSAAALPIFLCLKHKKDGNMNLLSHFLNRATHQFLAYLLHSPQLLLVRLFRSALFKSSSSASSPQLNKWLSFVFILVFNSPRCLLSRYPQTMPRIRSSSSAPWSHLRARKLKPSCAMTALFPFAGGPDNRE